jgi:hypothetical protein
MEFNFEINRRVLLWKQDSYTIEAENEEEAKKIIIKKYKLGLLGNNSPNINNIEWVGDEYFTNDELVVKPGKYSTESIYFNNNNLPDESIWDNRPIEIKRQYKLKSIGI